MPGPVEPQAVHHAVVRCHRRLHDRGDDLLHAVLQPARQQAGRRRRGYRHLHHEVVAIYTLVVRRLHDLGMGQPLAVIYLVIAILQPFFFRLIAELPEDSMEAQVVQGLNLFTMLLIVCLMLIRGKSGANQYGEDPLAHDIS